VCVNAVCLDPSAAAASRRAEVLGMAAPTPNFFYGSAESQPNFLNVPASRIFFGANSARTYSVVEMKEITLKVHILASCVTARCA